MQEMESKLFTELTATEQENLSGGQLLGQLGLNIAIPTAISTNLFSAGASSARNNVGQFNGLFNFIRGGDAT